MQTLLFCPITHPGLILRGFLPISDDITQFIYKIAPGQSWVRLERYSIIKGMEMKEIDMTFNGSILTIGGPEPFIDVIKENVMEILNDFADTQGMPLYKACQKLIEDKKTQTEFKLMTSLYGLFYL